MSMVSSGRCTKEGLSAIGSYVLILTLASITCAAAAARLTVRATRIRGELHGISILRCKLLPDTHQIRLIEWIKGQEKGESDYVYFDSTDPKERNATRKRGSFKTRNVSGLFINQSSAHELKINRSVGSDEDVYTCVVWTKAEEDRYSSHVNLKLNVKPKKAPSIQALDGRVLSTSDCHQPDVSVIQWTEKISLYCTVGEAKPPATVRWQNISGGMEQYEEKLDSWSYEDGLQLFSVKRRVDKTLQHDEKLRCTVNISNAEHDSFQVMELCVWIHLYDPPKAYKFSWIMNGVIIYIVILFLCVWLAHRVLFVTTGNTGRIVNHSTWYMMALAFTANTFTILHIQDDNLYHVQLLKKYQTLPDDPYFLYHVAWFWFGLVFFSSRLLSGIIATILWKKCYTKPECDLNESSVPLDNGNNGDSTTTIYGHLKTVGRMGLRILLGPSVLLFILLRQRKEEYKRRDYHKNVAATVLCVCHRLVFQTLYLLSGIALYAWSIPIRLTQEDGYSLQSPRIPTIILFVVLVLDIVVNAFIVVFVIIKKQRRGKGNKKDSN